MPRKSTKAAEPEVKANEPEAKTEQPETKTEPAELGRAVKVKHKKNGKNYIVSKQYYLSKQSDFDLA